MPELCGATPDAAPHSPRAHGCARGKAREGQAGGDQAITVDCLQTPKGNKRKLIIAVASLAALAVPTAAMATPIDPADGWVWNENAKSEGNLVGVYTSQITHNGPQSGSWGTPTAHLRKRTGSTREQR
jgi:hypothetical protein